MNNDVEEKTINLMTNYMALSQRNWVDRYLVSSVSTHRHPPPPPPVPAYRPSEW